MPEILLIDNGSRRPDATHSLRRLASALATALARRVHPVSLLHASQIPAAQLDGQPAQTLEPFLAHRCAAGERTFVAVPLFFGPSRALSAFVPEVTQRVSAAVAPIRVQVADVLCPLPDGEPRLVEILAQHAETTCSGRDGRADQVILVDHGSPLPEVTAVRRWLASGLAARLGPSYPVCEAVMERRTGAEYDFNGALLGDVLAELAGRSPMARVVVAMQFVAPGRHAGPGGDIEQTCLDAVRRHPGLRIARSPLVGEHPMLIEILRDRVEAVLGKG